MARAVLLLMLYPVTASAQSKQLYGFVRDFSNLGVVTIDPANPQQAKVIKSSIMPTAGAIKDSVMYLFAMDDDFNTVLYRADIVTGKVTLVKNLGEDAPLPMEMSYNYADEKMYFVTNSELVDGMSSLWSIDLTTGKFTKVKENIGIFVRGLAISVDGDMYALNGEGNLYRFNKDNRAQLVGVTGITPSSFSSMAFERSQGKLYLSARTDDGISRLYQIDITTAIATSLGTIGAGNGYWTVALDAPYKASEAAAPAKVENLTATADQKGELSVALSWTNPSVSTANAPLSALQKAEVLRDGKIVATLTDIKPGEQATYTDIVPAAALYRYTVKVYNEVGGSADRFVDVYIGHDRLSMPLDVRADLYNSGSNIITWSAPVTGIHNGFVSPDGITYDVVRVNDGKLIAANISARFAYDDSLQPMLTRYQYKVVARNADGIGDTAVSNYLVNGESRTIPFTADFNDEAESNLWTVLNNNHDETTFLWHYDVVTQRNYYMYQTSATMYANDMIVSPPIEFEDGHSYKITVSACNDFAPYPETFRLYTLNGYTLEGAAPLGDEEFVCNEANVLKDYSYELQLPDRGLRNEKFTSFIAVGCTSKYDSHIFMVGSVKIEDTTVATSIHDTFDTDKHNKIYNLQGQFVGADIHQLSKGIYIINQRKVIIR